MKALCVSVPKEKICCVCGHPVEIEIGNFYTIIEDIKGANPPLYFLEECFHSYEHRHFAICEPETSIEAGIRLEEEAINAWNKSLI